MNKNELIKKQICSFLDRVKPETRFIHIQTINENGHIIDRLKTGYITEPEYIRYDHEDDMDGWFIYKNCIRAGFRITEKHLHSVCFTYDGVAIKLTYKEFLNQCRRPDGTPAGKLK